MLAKKARIQPGSGLWIGYGPLVSLLLNAAKGKSHNSYTMQSINKQLTLQAKMMTFYREITQKCMPFILKKLRLEITL